MKRFLVSATTAAVLTALSSGAFAVVNLDDGTGSANYAKELVVAGTTALSGAAVDVTSTLGFGVSNAQTRYIRYDLTNAKFQVAVVPADLVVPTTTTVVSQGGGANSTFVIFQITATAEIPQNALVAFASGSAAGQGLIIQDASAPVLIGYSLYEDAPSAAAGGAAGRLNTANSTPQVVAGLVSGLKFSTVPTTTTVNVTSPGTPYTQFIAGGTGTSTTVAQIGTVNLSAATPVLNPGTGAQVTYPQLVAAGSALVLKGDFGAALSPSTASTGVYLGSNGGDCAGAGTAPTPATPTTSATFVTNAAPVNDRPLCFSVSNPNTKPIPAQSFTVETALVPQGTASTGNFAAIGAGTFVRNGLVLKAAFAETTAVSGIATAVSMSNTSGNAAPYTVRCLVNSPAVVVGIPGTVPANSSTRQSLGTPGLGCPTNGTLRGIEITLSTPPGSVIGSLVRQNTSTGQASFDSMTNNQ